MNAITAHRISKDGLIIPILINTEAIISIEPIYSPNNEPTDGTVIKTPIEKYAIKELYEDVISTLSRNTNVNSIYDIRHYAPRKPISLAEYDLNNLD